jgi:UDP-N-acetylglucosamine--N-acetylmuramyl-(pentapeptide) pyrophosphoryl-undecaprenol N-acetylglucosamine transferase
VIAAGGTGGHLFPAEALATELIARGHPIVLMTDARSRGIAGSVFAERPHFVLRGAGIAGRGPLRAAAAALGLAAGTAHAAAILGRCRPGVVVGFGGYPCVAPVLAAQLLRSGPRVVLHEQNAVLGRANRLLSRRADALALSFAATDRVSNRVPTVLTGNPVRPIFQPTPYAPPRDEVRLLILGGSLGARVFSDVVPPALAALADSLRLRIMVVQQCRAEDLVRVRAAYNATGIVAELATFFPNIVELLADAHLVIARAGASTVAELCVVGRPAVLVPLPGAIDDHQGANARALAGAGGAWVLPQPTLSVAELRSCLASLLTDPVRLGHAAASAAALSRADAAGRLADLVESLLPQEVLS